MSRVPLRSTKAGLPGGRTLQPLVALDARRAGGRGVTAVVRAATAEAAPETFTYQAEVRGRQCMTSTTTEAAARSSVHVTRHLAACP